MRILILGGAGFIGSHLVSLLDNNNEHELIVLDNLSSGSRKNIPPTVKFYQMDIRDNDLDKIFEEHRFDVVVNLAAQTMVPYSLEHPDEDADINILGLIYVSNATQSTSYGSEIQKQDAEISALEVKISDLEVENARLTSLNSIRDSEVAKTMTAPTSVNYAE